MEMILNETTRFMIRVHVRRKPGQTPNYANDVRHYNCETMTQVIARVSALTRDPNISQVEVFSLLESWKAH